MNFEQEFIFEDQPSIEDNAVNLKFVNCPNFFTVPIKNAVQINLESLFIVHSGLNSMNFLKGLVLPSLRTLSLQSNGIALVEGLESCPRLEKLLLNCNKVECIRGILLAQKLCTLEVASNKMKYSHELQEVLSALNIEKLLLANNPICENKTYVVQLAKSTSIREVIVCHPLYCKDNAFCKNCIREVRPLKHNSHKSTAAMLKFLKHQYEEETTILSREFEEKSKGRDFDTSLLNKYSHFFSSVSGTRTLPECFPTPKNIVNEKKDSFEKNLENMISTLLSETSKEYQLKVGQLLNVYQNYIMKTHLIELEKKRHFTFQRTSSALIQTKEFIPRHKTAVSVYSNEYENNAIQKTPVCVKNFPGKIGLELWHLDDESGTRCVLLIRNKETTKNTTITNS